jgi:riboflavin synthase
MFTGIIREIGTVRSLKAAGGLYKLEVACKDVSASADIGDSVSVNGVCLTVTAKAPGALYFDVVAETIRRTTLAGLRSAERVNLEGSLKAGSGIDGHFVLGHVDCVGKVVEIIRAGGEFVMRIGFPGRFAGLLVEKGSVAIEGVSLTAGEISDNMFSVYLIPQTLKSTSLGSRPAGSSVNIEFDVIGKYAVRMKPPGGAGITESFLKENGF